MKGHYRLMLKNGRGSWEVYTAGIEMQILLLHMSLILLYFKQIKQPQSSLGYKKIISLSI